MKVVISSGHGLHIRGASGYLDEVDCARLVVNRVAELLKNVGVKAVVFHDDTSTTQDKNLKTIVDFHNGELRDLDVSVHFNCYDGSASGCECLYVSSATLAEEVSGAISDAAGFKDRGAKKRTDLYFLNQTDEPAILIEVCFVDSVEDVDLYHQHFEAICVGISDAISGIEQPVSVTDSPPEAEINPSPLPLPAKKLLGNIEGCDIWCIEQDGKERVEWTAKMAVCCDGMPENDYDDPYYQRATAYYKNTTNNGYLDADKVPYIVVPPLIRNKTKGVVMGCQGVISNIENGQNASAICGEIGPENKLGEASCEAARRVGLDGNPNHGGTDDKIIKYVIWPDKAATVDNITYKLQPA